MITDEMKVKIQKYLKSLEKEDTFWFLISKPIRLLSIYLHVTTSHILDLEKKDFTDYILKCQDEETHLFGADVDYPPHILYTLNALQALFLLNKPFYCEKMIQSLKALVKQDGSIMGDLYGELDTRFTCCWAVIHQLLFMALSRNDTYFCSCCNEAKHEIIESYIHTANSETSHKENLLKEKINDSIFIYQNNRYNKDNETKSDTFKNMGDEKIESDNYKIQDNSHQNDGNKNSKNNLRKNENNSFKNSGNEATTNYSFDTQQVLIKSKNNGFKDSENKKVKKYEEFNVISQQYFMRNEINIDKIVEYIHSCQNFDYGYGAFPSAESHTANTFCCISALRCLNKLDEVDINDVSKFLCFRQTDSFGLNGRPYKKEDVCYSYWTYSTLEMLETGDYIDKEGLIQFIFQCYDINQGSFSDRPGNESDLFHTCYALISLSILGVKGLKKADPGLGF